MRPLLLLPLVLSFIITAADSQTLLRTIFEKPGQILRYSSGGEEEEDCGGGFCDSWRLSVETNNAGPWEVVPKKCLGFVERYVNGHRYSSDVKVAAGEAISFAHTVEIAGDGKDVWVFDVDETLLSNLDYYRLHGYGSEPFDPTSFNQWVYLAEAPALQANLRLYKELQGLGFQIVLLTGRDEYQRNTTEANLLFAGYSSWEKLIMRGASDAGKSAVIYKSEKRAELVSQGFRIHGSSGDQWSDLLGSPMATRSFKVPNPMYYIS
ncbi:putative acid phosphatase 1 [Iris pallida]|uniref:Acid phosphatase 1 n=1 Tax=Iris pallida TaxID=29817 RepID=A0AAX6G9H3_IRIPA|nr:putative acid phosphatase 1 [Iris pallida]